MISRDLSLTQRREGVREKHEICPSVQEFSLDEIKCHFDESINQIESNFSTAEALMNNGNAEGCKNIWRSQIVFVESALDFYLHELSKIGFANIFSGRWNKTDRYNNHKVPMKQLEIALKNPESNSWIFEYANERFSREVFLSKESMKDQLNLLGVNFEPVISSAFPKSTDPSVKNRSGSEIISDLFERRNLIAHQSDRNHYDANQNEISREYVEQCINDVKKLVESIHNYSIRKGCSDEE